MPRCCVNRRPRVPCHIYIGLCYIVVSQNDDQNDALKEGENLSKIALTPATHTHPFVFFSAFECANLKMPCHPVWHLEDTIGNCKSTPGCRSKPKKLKICMFSMFVYFPNSGLRLDLALRKWGTCAGSCHASPKTLS